VETAEFRKFLDHKFVIFDTNIFIKASEHFDAFKVLFDFIKECNCKAVYFPLIEFEFTRGDFHPDYKKEREEFLNRIATERLVTSDKLIYNALDIARVYAHQKIQSTQINIIDCCIAAYLQHYNDKLFLLTLNHKDFPTTIFDRLYVHAVYDDADVFAPAFYSFNLEKWKILQDQIDKIKT
jgi:predicted nucleic acid-binding protein